MKHKYVCFFIYFIGLSHSLFCQQAKPSIFEIAFSNDTSWNDLLIPYKFYTSDLGKIKIESGKIIACDAEEMHNSVPFVQIFPKGEFLVQLAIAKEEYDYEFVAYSRILFSKNVVEQWQYALVPGLKKKPINDTSYKGCDLNTGFGVGIFIDSITNKIFNLKTHKEWANVFIDKLKKGNRNGLIQKFNRGIFAAFMGNVTSCYGVYIGYDKEGKICRLLADMQTLQLPPSIFWR